MELNKWENREEITDKGKNAPTEQLTQLNCKL